MQKVSEKTQKSRDNKALLMKLILDKKDVLFGKFGDPASGLTQEKQKEYWEQVRQEAVSKGYEELREKDFHYVRYELFSKFKTHTLQKHDKAKKTGQNGQGKLTEVGFS